MSEGPKQTNPFAPPAPSIQDNLHFKPKSPSARMEKFREKIDDFNIDVRDKNKERKAAIEHAKSFTGVRYLLCGLCQGQLNKKKPIKKDIGLGRNFDIPMYRCSVCAAKYLGRIPRVYHESKPDIEVRNLIRTGVSVLIVSTMTHW